MEKKRLGDTEQMYEELTASSEVRAAARVMKREKRA
jgi:hypothetical protein